MIDSGTHLDSAAPPSNKPGPPQTEYRHKISHEESLRIRRFLYLVAVGTVVFAALLLVAFLTADRWLLLFSHESERRFSDRYVMLAKRHLLQPGDPVLQDYVEGLTEQIAGHMDVPDGLRIRVHVIKGSVVNAGATLGGHIFVFEGLLHRLDSENGLVMVLAHELAHCINRDPLRSAGRGILWEVAVSSFQGTNLPGVDFGENQLMLNVYSRKQEQAADRQALATLQARYGHVGGATQLFEVLRESGADAGSPELLSTHPAIDRRIGAINTMAGENGWYALSTKPHPSNVKAALNSKP